VRRKELLTEVVPKLGALRYLDHIETRCESFLAQVTTMGLEGIVAKKSTSRYRGGRSGDWLKIKAERSGDFVIVGFTKPKRQPSRTSVRSNWRIGSTGRSYTRDASEQDSMMRC